MPSYLPESNGSGGSYVPPGAARAGSYIDGPESTDQGPPSLWGQFKATVGAIPSLIVHMGADLGQDAYAITQVPSALALGVAANMPGQAGADLVQGIHRNRFLRPFVGEEQVINAARGMGFTENVHATMPFMGSMGTSFRGTGERVVNQGAALAPGGLAAGDSQYGQAVREGNILPVLVEDVGNAALLSSAGSRVARAAAEPAVVQAQVAEAAARATAPLETGGATAARSAVTPGAGRGGSWFSREGIRPTVRDLAREARLPSSPADAVVQEAMQAPTARVFEVGGAGPAATTQLIDDAAAQATRATATDLAARAARLQRVARNLHTAARLGDTLADVPARVWTAPIGAAARGVAPAVGAVLRTAPGQAVGEYLDNTVGQAVRNQRARAEFRRFIHENGELPKAEGAGEIRQTAIAAERLLEDPIEGYAGHLVVSGVADTMGPIIRGMQDDLGAQLGVDPADARRWAIEEALGDIDKPETFDPVDAFELADQYARTRAYNAAVEAEAAGGPPAGPPPPDLMPPEQMARIDQSQELLREGVRAARQSRFFRGKGESRGPRPEEEAARVTQEMLDRGAGPREVSAASEAAAAAARQREADLLATRQEQRGSSPLSVVVRKATERFAPKIDAAIDRVADAQARAAKAGERRIVDPEEFKRSVTAQVKQLYADARDVADTIVRTDPVLARTIAAPDPRIRLTDDQLADRLAGRLVSARGSRTPELRQLMEDLKAAGFEMPFDLPNPAALLPAERRAGTAERARVFARQAAGDEGTAATAAAQAQAWREKPQPIVEPRPGFATGLERAAVGATRARERAAAGPNVRDVDLEVRDRRRAAAAEAQGVEVRPGEVFRVPREKITGEAAMPQPLQNYIDADGVEHDGMLVELDMRGATLHPQVGGVSEVTPGRFMPNERVFLAYNDEGRAIGYLAVYGDTGLSIAVDPEARGQGVGVRLYEAAEAAGVDVHRNLADETFTADGARTYERFVNGPADGERVTFDRPVQREVFEKAARTETEAETRDRIARQGEQQALGEPVEAPGPRMVDADGNDLGEPPTDVEPGDYLYNPATGELRPRTAAQGEVLETPASTDPNGMPDYYHQFTPDEREAFMRAHPDLPFDGEEQNIVDQWADKPAERQVRVRVTPGVFEDLIDAREMPMSYEGPANAYAKIEAAGTGFVTLTEAEARELYEEAAASADPSGQHGDNRGLLQAYTLLAHRLKTALEGGDSLTREAAVKLFTKPQQVALDAFVKDRFGGWPGADGFAIDTLREALDDQVRRLHNERASGVLDAAGTRQLKALENAMTKLDDAFPPPARPTLDPGQLDQFVFNATVYRHFEDIYGGERANPDEVPVTVEAPEDTGPPPAIEVPPAPTGIDPVAWNRAYDEARAEADARPEEEWVAEDTERVERVRRAANTAAADTIAEIDRQFGGSRIAYLPDLKPGQRRGEGNVSGAELEPVDAYLGRLSPNERAAWRKRWMVSKAEAAQGERGLGADELALYQDWGGQEGSVGSGDVEQAFADFVALTERFDALNRIEQGVGSEADIDLVGDFLTGVDRADLTILEPTVLTRQGRLLKGEHASNPNARRGRSVSQHRRPSLATRLARAKQQFIDSRAEGKIGPEPPAAAEGRRSPWEMSVEDYTAELTTAEATVAQWAEAHPWNPEDDFGPVEPPEVEAARTRINELAPQGFDDLESPLAAEELHARLLEAARTHGLAERETPGPARVFDPIARGVEAVADVEQRALEAFIEDAENRRVAKLSGQSVPREDYLYNTLNEPARRIYRQMVADTKVLTEEQRLELARRQLGQKLISRGRRAQAPISRQEGRVMARERILQSRAEQSAKAAERAQERVEAGPTRYEARTESMGRALGPFARGQRTVGLREGEARARELDLGREERTLIRLLDKQAEAERKARNSPEAAPARFATELRAGGNLKKAIEDQAEVLDSISDDGRGGDVLRALTVGIPQSVFDAVRIGGDAADPEHLIGGDFGRRRSGAALGKLDESLPYVRKTGQERIKSRTEGETDFTIRGQAIEEIKRHTDAVRNDLARRVQEKFGVRPDDLGVELRGRELVEEMKARDFVPWDPANPLLTPPPSQVTGQTTFIPRQLMIAFKKSSFGEKPRWQLNLETWYDRRFLGTIKTWWLALSPRWQLGNLVGNSLMSVIGGGVDPVTLVRQMRNARALLAEDPTGELLARQQHLLATRGNIPRTLLNRGMTHEEMTFLNPELDRPVRNPIARVARKSYAMNEYTDNLFRSAVYLAKLEPRAHLWDQLDAGQISPEQFMAQVGSTLSARQALDGALHAAGDFQNLTPFERSVVKRLWIFYPWYRHITKLTLSLPVNHPTRVIWTLHLAQMFGDDDQDQLPGFLQGSIPLGGDRYLRTGNLNPFGGVENSPLLSPGSAVAGLTPAITWPAAILMGVDLSRGGAQISRPPGTERLDSYGRPTNTPLWRNPAELLRYAATQFPQGRAAYGAIEDPVLRYGQGSPVLVQGETIPTGSSRWSTVGRLFGVPLPERIDVAAINQRRAEREAAARAARERYNENLSGVGAGR